jgi:dolichyl-diphosphooligosaccharide--protein glycosyltransferase
MTDVRETTEEFLVENPGIQDDFEELVAVDAANGTWAFDDIPLDSGTFGEVVSREIVEKHEGEYRLRDRDAVEQALGLADETEETADTETEKSRNVPSFSDSILESDVDRVTALSLAGALALVVLFRVLPFSSVFRDDDVVLSGNDPYAYRYLVHQLLAESGSVLDVSVLSSLPGGISHGEPLYVATLWWISALFGGTGAADYVLALYPVVSAVVTALLVYVLTVRVTEDKRAGIAAVALLAVIPAHAFRTGLGFADHHAFDYPILALSLLTLVFVARIDADNYRDDPERDTYPSDVRCDIARPGLESELVEASQDRHATPRPPFESPSLFRTLTRSGGACRRLVVPGSPTAPPRRTGRR